MKPSAGFLKVKFWKSKLLNNANPMGNAISAKTKLKPILPFMFFNALLLNQLKCLKELLQM